MTGDHVTGDTADRAGAAPERAFAYAATRFMLSRLPYVLATTPPRQRQAVVLVALYIATRARAEGMKLRLDTMTARCGFSTRSTRAARDALAVLVDADLVEVTPTRRKDGRTGPGSFRVPVPDTLPDTAPRIESGALELARSVFVESNTLPPKLKRFQLAIALTTGKTMTATPTLATLATTFGMRANHVSRTRREFHAATAHTPAARILATTNRPPSYLTIPAASAVERLPDDARAALEARRREWRDCAACGVRIVDDGAPVTLTPAPHGPAVRYCEDCRTTGNTAA